MKHGYREDYIELLRTRFTQLATYSKMLQADITSASTVTKKRYLTKKLKKNNDIVIKLLVQLDAADGMMARNIKNNQE